MAHKMHINAHKTQFVEIDLRISEVLHQNGETKTPWRVDTFFGLMYFLQHSYIVEGIPTFICF